MSITKKKRIEHNLPVHKKNTVHMLHERPEAFMFCTFAMLLMSQRHTVCWRNKLNYYTWKPQTSLFKLPSLFPDKIKVFLLPSPYSRPFHLNIYKCHYYDLSLKKYSLSINGTQWPLTFLPAFDGIESALWNCQFSLTQNKIPQLFLDLEIFYQPLPDM